MTFAGGAEIFGAFVVLYTLVVIYSLYTRTGSGINQRPYNNEYGGAPGAKGSSSLSHDQRATAWGTRGTR